MRFVILAAVTLLIILCLVTPVQSFNDRHLRQLQDTNICRKCDLKEADLSSKNLHSADLRQADLRGADLKGADLSNADLKEADLRGVRNITLAQVKVAKNWQKARFDEPFARQLGL